MYALCRFKVFTSKWPIKLSLMKLLISIIKAYTGITTYTRIGGYFITLSIQIIVSLGIAGSDGESIPCVLDKKSNFRAVRSDPVVNAWNNHPYKYQCSSAHKHHFRLYDSYKALICVFNQLNSHFILKLGVRCRWKPINAYSYP